MRKTLAFLLISMFVCALLVAPSFGAKADASSHYKHSKLIKDIEPLPIADEGDFISAKGSDWYQTATDAAAPEDSFPGYRIGTTTYDYQHNGTMGRNIARGDDGRIHFAYMYKPTITPGSADRDVRWNSATAGGGGGWTLSHPEDNIIVYAAPSGYVTVDVWRNRAIVGWHAGLTEDAYTTHCGVDFNAGGGSFSTSEAPLDNCKDYDSNGDDGNYIWPIVTADDIDVNNAIIHAVSCETDNDHTLQSIMYHRAQFTHSATFDWRDCEAGDPYTEGGLYVDSVSTIAPVVRQDPNSDKVAIVWTKPLGVSEDEAYQQNCDIYYSVSNNLGVDWGTPDNITEYQDADLERAYTDLTAMYDADGYLHVVWNSITWNEEEGTFSYTDDIKLWHWDEFNDCISLINAAQNSPCDPGRWNMTLTKPNIAQCDDTLLYVSYTWFLGTEDEADQDCSQGGYANGELYVQASSTGGLTWGPPINLSNTEDNNCDGANGGCESEMWATMAMYTEDSLYILYVGDRDAGGWAGGGSGFEGSPQVDPLMFLPYPCFAMDPYLQLAASPSSLLDPFHGAPSSTVDTSLTLLNVGNIEADFTIAYNYISGSGWLSATSGVSTVGAGCDNKATLNVQVSAPGTEGLYQAEILVNYTAAKEQLVIPVDFYCFEEFYTPWDDAVIRTNANELNVRNASGMGNQQRDEEFYWWIDSTEYLFDASLILGTDRNNMNWNLFHAVGDKSPSNNPWKELRALSITDYDSTSYPYRYAEGTGCTEDSTIQFTSKYYASKHPDSVGFYVAHYDIFAGPNFSTDINNLMIAYGADWDVPSDTGSDNEPNFDAAKQLVYQQGAYTGSADDHDQRFGGMAYRGDDSTYMLADGGFAWNNDNYVYPSDDYQVDSLVKYIMQTSATPYFINNSDTLPITDYNSIIVVDRDATIGAANTISFSLIVASSNPHHSKSLVDLETSIAKAEQFICEYVAPEAPHCLGGPPCKCGDADGNDIWNISDAVFLIAYIFGGGPAPDPLCLGDADGNGIVNISDAVYLIAYIFGGGPEPHCPE